MNFEPVLLHSGGRYARRVKTRIATFCVAAAGIVVGGAIVAPAAQAGSPVNNINVTVAGTGSGTVTAENESGAELNCPPACSTSYPAGSTATLISTPAPGSAFTGISGITCNNGRMNPCVFNVGFGANDIVVTFGPAPVGDADDDGVTDDVDACPDEAGAASNAGCPEPGASKCVKAKVRLTKAKRKLAGLKQRDAGDKKVANAKQRVKKAKKNRKKACAPK